MHTYIFIVYPSIHPSIHPSIRQAGRQAGRQVRAHANTHEEASIRLQTHRACALCSSTARATPLGIFSSSDSIVPCRKLDSPQLA